jgi:ABC-2 type transport system ATP-binding protein
LIALEVAHLRKRYGPVEALRGVSFAVASGEVLGYLGPNGAGKTTTLRILAGLVHADGGRASLFGEPPASPRARARLGYLPGELRLYGDMRVQTMLDLLARFRHGRGPVLRPRLLEAFELSSVDLRRRVKQLSHGTRQKVGLVLAMQHDPDLLVLDEPTIGLDPLVQRAFRELVLDRAAAGRAVLLSSHVLSEVEAVCNRVAVLRAGELVALEQMETLRARFVRRARVQLRGQPPADLLAGPGVTRSEVRGAETILWIQGDVNPLLRVLARIGVERFVFEEPQLEDLFMGFFA